MLITRSSLVKRLLDDDPKRFAQDVRRYLASGDRSMWRTLVSADWLSSAERADLWRRLLAELDDEAARHIVEHLDRCPATWRPFLAALVREHPQALRDQLLALLTDQHAGRVTIGIVGLGALAAGDRSERGTGTLPSRSPSPFPAGEAEAASFRSTLAGALRTLIITGDPVDEEEPVSEAIRVLGRLADDQSLTLLAQLCRHPEAWRRRAAAYALADARNPEAVRLLLPFAEDRDLVSGPVAALLARQVNVAALMTARDLHLARVGLVIFRALVAALGGSVDLRVLPRLHLAEQAEAATRLYVSQPRLPVVEAVLDLADALTQRWRPAWRRRRAVAPDAEDTRRLGQTLDAIQGLLDRMGPLDRSATVKALIDGVDDPEEEYVRRGVACLGRLRNAAAVEPLLAMLPNAWGPLRRAVIQALGAIGRGQAAEPLQEALRARLDERTRAQSSEPPASPDGALEVTDLFQALCRLDGGTPMWVHRAALQEPDEPTRAVAAESLGRLIAGRDREALELARRTLADDGAAAVRAAAARALGQATAGDAADVLADALEDPDDAVRLSAVRSLGLLRALQTTDAIQRLMRDSLRAERAGGGDWAPPVKVPVPLAGRRLAHEAAIALARINPGRLPATVVHTLVQMATHPLGAPGVDEGHVLDAIAALGRLDIYEAQIALEHLAKDQNADPAVRRAAEEARWKRS